MKIKSPFGFSLGIKNDITVGYKKDDSSLTFCEPSFFDYFLVVLPNPPLRIASVSSS